MGSKLKAGEEPGASTGPFAFNGAAGEVKRLGDFFRGEATEEAHFQNLGLAGVHCGEFIERIVDSQELLHGEALEGGMEAGGGVDGNGFIGQAAGAGSSVVDQNAAHHRAGEREVRFQVECRSGDVIDSKEELVDEGCWLEGVAGTLAAQVHASKPFELKVSFIKLIGRDKQRN